MNTAIELLEERLAFLQRRNDELQQHNTDLALRRQEVEQRNRALEVENGAVRRALRSAVAVGTEELSLRVATRIVNDLHEHVMPFNGAQKFTAVSVVSAALFHERGDRPQPGVN